MLRCSYEGKERDAMNANAESNRLRREADKHKIGSPYRINEYIEYRLRGDSEEEALKKVKEGKR